MAEPIRCDGKHPDFPGRPCDGKLFDGQPSAVQLRAASGSPREYVVVTCRRCGKRHSVTIRVAA